MAELLPPVTAQGSQAVLQVTLQRSDSRMSPAHLVLQVLLGAGQLQVRCGTGQGVNQRLGEGDACVVFVRQGVPVPCPPAVLVVPAKAQQERSGGSARGEERHSGVKKAKV